MIDSVTQLKTLIDAESIGAMGRPQTELGRRPTESRSCS
jgi:hypothetical protein